MYTLEAIKDHSISYGNALGDCNVFLGSFFMFMSKFGAYESRGLVSFENNCVYSVQRTEQINGKVFSP